jgi:hypothetical protein
LIALFGAGMRLTESLGPETALAFEAERVLPGGSVEIVYRVTAPSSEVLGGA